MSDLDSYAGTSDFNVVIVMPLAMLDDDMIAIPVPFDTSGATNAVRALLRAYAIGKRGR
ncbi:MAG TPA: hypothetical protein VKW08_27170 [Xanthobacteraceae bacterium]|jgi:hypothetical protein|nr:hypothetical protein [Xanthobacteraceae bacterium]